MSNRAPRSLTEMQILVLRIDSGEIPRYEVRTVPGTAISAARRVLERRGLIVWTDRANRAITVAGREALAAATA